MSVRAAAESIASRPTRFRSKYGVASRPYFFFCSPDEQEKKIEIKSNELINNLKGEFWFELNFGKDAFFFFICFL